MFILKYSIDIKKAASKFLPAALRVCSTGKGAADCFVFVF